MPRAVNAAAQAIRLARGPLMEIPMVWVEGRNRETGLTEGIGFWAGGETVTVALVDLWARASRTRTFIGTGSLLDVGTVPIEAGFSVRPMQVSLSGASPEVELAVRGYDLRGAKAQVFRSEHDPATHARIGIAPVFKGYIDRINWVRPEPGGAAVIVAEVVSAARTLSITSEQKRSDAFYKARGSGLARYVGTAGRGEIIWGGKDARPR